MPEKRLVIVESPAKARTIGRYLGADHQVAASVGHVRDLPKKELGVDVEGGFEPTWVTIRGKGKVLADLARKARSADVVVLATDPDREGEAIAWHVADRLGWEGGDDGRFRRVRFREVTPGAVRAAMERPGGLDMRKVEAQQARRILDRLVGYRVSPFLWGPIRPGLSAGRVQTVALRLVCEREDEIRAFDAREYWSVTAHLAVDGTPFEARLHAVDGEDPELPDADAAAAVVRDVEGAPFVAAEVERKRRRKNPRPPFTTSTLQQEASRRLRFSAKRTMRTAQRLYEGVSLGRRGAVGLITYMRTDSTRVSKGSVAAARRWIAGDLGDSYLAPRPRYWSRGQQKGAQEAHEAIRPTDPSLHPSDAARHLDADGAKLYELIWLRFVMSQMAPALYDTTTADFDVQGRESGRTLRFRATGSTERFPGFLRLERDSTLRRRRDRSDGDQALPPLEGGDEAELREVEPKQHFTRPPARFSEATLVKELEARGIGRPSTYASIIDTLGERGYVAREKGRFHPTELGEVVARLLVRVFPDIFDVDFTSRMEDALDRVEEGEVAWRELLGDFHPRLEARLAEGRERGDAIVKEILAADGERCEACGEPMLVRWNEGGRFLGCSAYPACSTTRPLDGEERADRLLGTDPATGRRVRVKDGPYGPYVEREAPEGGEPDRVSVPAGDDPDELELERALALLSLPRSLGTDPGSGDEVVAGLNKHGPYVRVGRRYADLPDADAALAVTLDEAVRRVREKKKRGKGGKGGRRRKGRGRSGGGKVLKDLGVHRPSTNHIRVLDGRYGPYVTDGNLNASLPKGVDPSTVEMEEAIELLAEKASRGSRRGGRSRGRKGRRRGRGGRR